MPRILPIPLEQADARSAATLRAVQHKLGILPNMFATFARSPAALASYVQQTESLAAGRLTAGQRERIALAVAQDNACEYCLSAHAALGQGAGLGTEEIARARQGGAGEALDGLITRFALAVAHSRAEISDAELAAFRDGGLDDGLIIEIIAQVALNVLTNYVNKIAGTEIDFPRISLDTAA